MALIGYDLRRLNLPLHTGVSRCVVSLAAELAALYPEDYLFLGDPVPGMFGPDAKVMRFGSPLGYVDLHQKIMALYTWASDLSLLFVPYKVPPVEIACKSALLSYDLIPLRHPEWFPEPDVREYFGRVLKDAAKRVDGIIAISEHTKSELNYFYGIQPEKITVAYPAADAVFHQIAASETTPPVIMGKEVPRPYILAACTLEPRKNLRRTIKAYGLFRDRFPKEKPLLVLAGVSDPKYGDLTAEILSSPYLDDIIVTGRLSDANLAKLYKYCELFAFPSIFEGYGLPIMEAMASGAPVITTSNTAIAEVGGDAAMYCEPENVDSIATCMEKILGDDELRKSMREKGLERAATFTWRQAAVETHSMFKRILGRD